MSEPTPDKLSLEKNINLINHTPEIVMEKSDVLAKLWNRLFYQLSRACNILLFYKIFCWFFSVICNLVYNIKFTHPKQFSVVVLQILHLKYIYKFEQKSNSTKSSWTFIGPSDMSKAADYIQYTEKFCPQQLALYRLPCTELES